MAEERTTDVTAGPGGVMTDEVGVVTGDLTVKSELDDSLGLVVRVQYKDAAEWYTVTGASTTLADAGQLDAAHAELVRKAAAGQLSGA
jgi:hypothetical protein